LALAALSFFLVYRRMKHTPRAMIARPATPPTAPPTMAPIGVPDEEVDAALVVGPIGAVVVGEPPLPPILSPPAELWPPEPAELDGWGGAAELEDGFRTIINGIPVVPAVGTAEVSVTVRGEKTRPPSSKL
jgi:hypothetical protein